MPQSLAIRVSHAQSFNLYKISKNRPFSVVSSGFIAAVYSLIPYELSVKSRD